MDTAAKAGELKDCRSPTTPELCICTNGDTLSVYKRLYTNGVTPMVLPTVKRDIFKCTRCGHEWLPRSVEKPERCAKCKSPYWDKPRKDTESTGSKPTKAKK
jgi:DNA-directed RNA polymerase subunit RPC12/RpoP